MIMIIVAVAAAVIPWWILIIVWLGINIPFTVRWKGQKKEMQIVFPGIAIGEAALYAITLLNMGVVIGSAALSLETGTVKYWPAFLVGYMFFAVPIFLLALIGSHVESNNERVREVEDDIRMNMIENRLKKGRG